MKYIEAEKITAEIDKIIDGLKRNCNPDPLGTTEECLAAAEIEALELLKTTIDQMHQEQPTPPGIEEESQKKGWLVLHVTKMWEHLADGGRMGVIMSCHWQFANDKPSKTFR